jgi:diguanylate cyclase (GGDEF)-like protein
MPQPHNPNLGHDPLRADQLANWRWIVLALLATGTVAVEAALAMPSISATDDWVAHVAAAGFLVLGLWVAAFPAMSVAQPKRLSAVIILVTTVQISMLVAVARGTTVMPLFYPWPLLTAAYLFSRRAFALSIAWTVAAYAVALIFSPLARVYAWTDLLLMAAAMTVILLVVRVLSETANGLLDELRRIAAFDPLTNVLNRRSFNYLAEQAWTQAERDDGELAVVVLDLDHFKRINDRFGHAEGDRALQRVAAVLRDTFRADDIVARTGGEEFAVVLPGAELATARELVERFRAQLAESATPDDVPLTASVGIATRHQGDGIERLLVLADDATYVAKAAGRDRVSIAPDHAQLQPITAARAPSAAA